MTRATSFRTSLWQLVERVQVLSRMVNMDEGNYRFLRLRGYLRSVNIFLYMNCQRRNKRESHWSSPITKKFNKKKKQVKKMKEILVMTWPCSNINWRKNSYWLESYGKCNKLDNCYLIKDHFGSSHSHKFMHSLPDLMKQRSIILLKYLPGQRKKKTVH